MKKLPACWIAIVAALITNSAPAAQGEVAVRPVSVISAIAKQETAAYAEAGDLFASISRATAGRSTLRFAPFEADGQAAGVSNRSERVSSDVAAEGKRAARLLLAGSVDAAVLPSQAFLRQSALFDAARVPFLISTAEDHRRHVGRVTPRLRERLAELGLVLLATLPMRPVGLFAVEPRKVQHKGTSRPLLTMDAMRARLAQLMVAADPKPTTPGGAGDGAGALRAFEWGSVTQRPTEHMPQDADATGETGELVAIAYWPVALVVARRDRLQDLEATQDAARNWTSQRDQANAGDDASTRNAWERTRAAIKRKRGPDHPSLHEIGIQMLAEWKIDAGADGVEIAGSLEADASRR